MRANTVPKNSLLIIGGGIIGLLTAREAALSGMQVTVLERGSIGAGASWAGGGILAPLYPWQTHPALQPLIRWSQRQYPLLAEALVAETGIDPEWTASGLLILDQDEIELAAAWSKQTTMELQVLPIETAQQLEAHIAFPNKVLYWPWVAQVRNPRLLKALKAALLKMGVTIHEGIEAQGISECAGRVKGVDSRQGFFPSSHIVIAAGAWSSKLLTSLPPHIPPIVPIRGQILLCQAKPNLLKHIVLQEDTYLVPRRDGAILIGSTVEQTGFDLSTTTTARSMLWERATTIMPALAHYNIIRQWAGLRPQAPNGVPYICAHPGVEGLYLNAGHYRIGLTLAPASAKFLVDSILGRESSFSGTAFAWQAER